MSFNVDLWNGFEIIKSSFFSNFKKVNLLTDILLSYSSHIKEHYTNLNNLYESLNESIGNDDSVFDNSLKLLLTSFKKESTHYINHYNVIMTNTQEIKNKSEKIKTDIMQYFKKNEENTENFNNVLNNLISKEENFNNQCKELCLNLANEEAIKILEERKKINAVKFKHSLTTRVPESKKEKKKNELIKVFDAKNNYIQNLSESNEERDKYNRQTDIILKKIQKQYKDLLCNFDFLIKAYISNKIDTHKEIFQSSKQYDENSFKNINYKTIFNDFVLKNATKEFPLNQFDFIPFKLSKSSLEKTNQKENKYIELLAEDKNKVYIFIQNFLTSNKINFYENDFSKKFLSNNINPIKGKNLLKENEISLNEENKIEINNIEGNEFEVINSQRSKEIKEKNMNFNFIKDFIFTLVVEDTVTNKDKEPNIKKEEKEEEENEEEEDIMNNIDEDLRIKYNTILSKFMDLISPKKKGNYEYLNFFIKFMTLNRAKGFFKLNPFVYKIFTNIFTYILMTYKNSNDCVKNVIILSQTFFKEDEENQDNKKIYLLNGLINHDSFKDPETWHRAINYNLSLSIKNSSKYSFKIINKDEYLKNLDKIAINTILSYLYDLRISTNDTKVYESVKYFYCTLYKIDEKMLEQQINSILENYYKEYGPNIKQINKKEENKDKINADDVDLNDNDNKNKIEEEKNDII